MDRSSFRLGDGTDGDACPPGRLFALAAERRLFGHRHLAWLLQREGHAVNLKKV